MIKETHLHTCPSSVITVSLETLRHPPLQVRDELNLEDEDEDEQEEEQWEEELEAQLLEEFPQEGEEGNEDEEETETAAEERLQIEIADRFDTDDNNLTMIGVQRGEDGASYQ